MTGNMTLTHDDYTVAWICALPLEMAAAKTMLEEIHSPLPQPPSDHNSYTLGRVNSHNVVVACLPSGVYGITSAATVLAYMRATFPYLKFGLMVGIGGGVPGKSDVRLGDVVVCMPTTLSSGVIQYDYGKTLHGGQFQHTGSLNKPPQILLTTISQIRSNDMIRQRSLTKIISGVLQKNQEMIEQFSRPDNDWLFNSTYNHQNNNLDCSACDQTRLISCAPRATKEPHIHYGLIASGNQVMKDAKTRDSIARDMDILCFEMEAAGLMDQLPCLVIRGICDYCDSHKHKQWQGYAALTAAAYAAQLLHAVPVTGYKAPSEQNMRLTEEEEACLRSLFVADPIEDKDALKRRKGDRSFGTCSWILETDELKHWLGLSTDISQEERSILWLYGNPGTGKSTMAITLSEELPNKPYFQSGSKTLAYFFCDSSSEVNRTAISVLRGLLYQLIKQHPMLMQHLLSKYAERRNKLFSSFDALWAVLMDIGKNSNHLEIYCIIDALDECELDSQKILLGQIDQTFNNLNSKHSSPLNIHFLITSRPYHEIRQSLASFRCKDLATYEAVANDLRTVIQEKVKFLSKRNRYPKAVVAEISQILEDKAEGTFLWVGIACDELAQVQSRNAAKTLQALPRGLDSLYRKLLSGAIATSGEDDERIIVEMLSFVAFALRPLTLAELSEACQLYPDEDEDCRLQFTKEFVDLCRLMIVIQGRHVRLLHKSVKDFLVKETRKIDSLKANATLAYRCISSILQTCHLGTDGNFSNPHHGFLNYSILYWPNHASLSEIQFTVIHEHESFFLPDSRSWGKWLCYYDSLQRYHSDKLDVGFSTFHAAARWGIPQLIWFALDGANAGYENVKPTCGGRTFVDSDVRTAKGVTPLAEAARSGQIETMRILLEKGPRNQQINKVVIEAAAGNTVHGKQVVTFLLDQCEDQIQVTDDMIKAAAQNYSHGKQIMTLLLERCKDQIQINTQLISAIIQSFDGTVVTFLLNQCGDWIQITDDMIKAAAQNYSHGKQIITLLLDRYKDQIQINTQFISAIIQSFDRTVATFLLVKCGDRIQITDDVFKAAARNYQNEEVMSLLLNQYGDQIQITRETGMWSNDLSIILKGEYEYADHQTYKAWRAYVAETGAPAFKAFLGYWRCINREAGEHYWNVPFMRRNPNFVTRNDEITKIERLITQHTVPARIAICGLGGVGKTEIALELAYRMRERDSEYSIFWISCTSHESVEQSYMSIANMLGFHDVKPAEAKDRVKVYLSQKKAGKWLLIFDNADDDMDMWDQGSTNAPGFLPQNEQGHILFTTRNQKLAVTLAFTVIQVSALDTEAALEILENSLTNKGLLNDYETAVTLLEQLNFLPLAIAQVAAYINAKNISLSDYKDLLGKRESEVLNLLSGQPKYKERHTDIQTTYTTILLISFQRIQQLNQLAADYLLFMAFMDPDNIPQSLLPQAMPKKKSEAISLLKTSVFVREHGRYHSLSIHRLIQHSIRTWLKTSQQFNQQILKAADRLTEVFPSDNHNHRKLWREYLPHALLLIREDEFQKEQERYISLIQKIGRCLASDGRYNEAAIVFENSMTKEKANDINPSALSSMAALAWIYERQGRWKDAEELGVKVVEINKRVMGPEHRDTLTGMGNLASTYRNQGRWKEAEELNLRVIGISKQALGPEYPDTLTCVSNLGLVLESQGKYEKAEAMHRQALEGYKKVLGPEHPDTLTSVSQLGSVLARQGKYKKAEAMHRQAFEKLEKVLGREHPDTLTTRHNLACTWNSMDRQKDALHLMAACAWLRLMYLGPGHPHTELSNSTLTEWQMTDFRNSSGFLDEYFGDKSYG